MTDREMLKLAAKAAGIEHPGGEHSRADDGRLWDCNGLRWWNPLTNDGDALRLAVALRINIWVEKTLSIVEVCSNGDEPNLIKKEYCDAETQMAATRRAIVRAAAAIGETMP